MALAGAGVGLAFGPVGIHARFSQPPERVAVVEGLQLFVSCYFPTLTSPLTNQI
jgi:hypothetical protein